jgi:hypothetical protein
MRGPREVLNELKWKEHALDDALVWYVHRGAPGDARAVSGRDVRALGASFLELGDASIPYHRVFRIERPAGTVVWERRQGPSVGA